MFICCNKTVVITFKALQNERRPKTVNMEECTGWQLLEKTYTANFGSKSSLIRVFFFFNVFSPNEKSAGSIWKKESLLLISSCSLLIGPPTAPKLNNPVRSNSSKILLSQLKGHQHTHTHTRRKTYFNRHTGITNQGFCLAFLKILTVQKQNQTEHDTAWTPTEFTSTVLGAACNQEDQCRASIHMLFRWIVNVSVFSACNIKTCELMRVRV